MQAVDQHRESFPGAKICYNSAHSDTFMLDQSFIMFQSYKEKPIPAKLLFRIN
jgi:hypothetical protein